MHLKLKNHFDDFRRLGRYPKSQKSFAKEPWIRSIKRGQPCSIYCLDRYCKILLEILHIPTIPPFWETYAPCLKGVLRTQPEKLKIRQFLSLHTCVFKNPEKICILRFRSCYQKDSSNHATFIFGDVLNVKHSVSKYYLLFKNSNYRKHLRKSSAKIDFF